MGVQKPSEEKYLPQTTGEDEDQIAFLIFAVLVAVNGAALKEVKAEDNAEDPGFMEITGDSVKDKEEDSEVTMAADPEPRRVRWMRARDCIRRGGRELFFGGGMIPCLL